MEIIHNQSNERKTAFSTIRGGKREADILQSGEKALIDQVAQALTVIVGGEMKRRRPASA
ncbi:MAG: hypothetical protein IPP51_02360 [Bacteroidetes bacterium]|nr:hypothetical protein [Bacteroidota bacterium]